MTVRSWDAVPGTDPPPVPGIEIGQVIGPVRVTDVSLIGWATSAVHVVPAICTTDTQQVVAYYGADRYLRVASRRQPRGDWWTTTLDTRIGWDSHNYVALGVDRAGHVHVAGNMHAVPLIYYRTQVPGDCTTLRRVDTMVDPSLEGAVTYPRFVRTHDGRLVFFFRNGASGSGDYEVYVYEEDAVRWTRPVRETLIDGETSRSSYLDTGAPILGPDGRYHLAWVWRDSPEAESTHTVCYAVSDDLAHWERADGSRVPLPITFGSADVVDPVPPASGLINNNVRLGFDAAHRPVIAYHRRDGDGRLQVFVARYETGWAVHQITDWDVRWDFAGRGSLDFEVEVGTPQPDGRGVVFDVRVGAAVRRMVVDESLSRAHLEELDVPWSPLLASPCENGLCTFVVEDSEAGRGDVRRFLIWESTPARRDAPLEGADLPPRPIHLVAVRDAG